jgi:AcrR family transcriptional regulator
MKSEITPLPRRIGRPRSFDREAALETAMHLFWRHGYEATSIAELTQAMGITPPSLYTAFGDKRGLFREAVDRYLGGGTAVLDAIREAPSAFAAARDLLTAAAISNTSPDTPPGCLLASSIVSSSTNAADVREEMASIRRAIEAALRGRIERDVQVGILPATTNAEMLAGHVFAVVQGMSTLAKDGARREKLLAIVSSVMQGWPNQPPPGSSS